MKINMIVPWVVLGIFIEEKNMAAFTKTECCLSNKVRDSGSLETLVYIWTVTWVNVNGSVLNFTTMCHSTKREFEWNLEGYDLNC